MATASWSFSPDHQTDASFRAWVQDFKTQLDAINSGMLVQTADTGQFVNSAETKPATNTTTPYLIYQFNDSLFGTAPIYIKFKFGTSTSSTRIRIDIEIGTGSNGSGTLTGTAKSSASIRCDMAGGGYTGASSYTSWMCCKDGVFWFAQYLNSQSGTCANWACITRTTDTSGAISATGAHLMTGCNGATAIQNYRFAATAATYLLQGQSQGSGSAYFAHIHHNESGTLTASGVPQTWPCMGYCPDFFPLFSAVAVKKSEVAEAATFTLTPFGSTAHTYIGMGAELSTQWGVGSNGASMTNYSLALIWE